MPSKKIVRIVKKWRYEAKKNTSLPHFPIALSNSRTRSGPTMFSVIPRESGNSPTVEAVVDRRSDERKTLLEENKELSFCDMEGNKDILL